MITILLHGSDRYKLQDRLGKFIDSAVKRGWHIERLSDDVSVIEEKLKGVSLFGQDNLFLLENPQKLGKRPLTYIKKNSKGLDGTLVFYSETSLTKTFISKLPKTDKEEKYDIPVLLWKFLDSFYPGNSKDCLQLFHQLLEDEPVEKIMALLSSHLRDLAIVARDSKKLDYPAWRVSKLSKTASKFKGESLKRIIRSLAIADVSAKSGKGDLSELLDLIILTKLE